MMSEEADFHSSGHVTEHFFVNMKLQTTSRVRDLDLSPTHELNLERRDLTWT